MIGAQVEKSVVLTWTSVVLWVISGACFVITAFVPWVDAGLLSSSSPVDLAGLSRSGVLATIPGWVPWLVAIMPLAGAVLLGTAVFQRTWLVRAVLLFLAALLWAAILREVGGTSRGGWALGAWLGALGSGLGASAILVEMTGRRMTSRAAARTS